MSSVRATDVSKPWRKPRDLLPLPHLDVDGDARQDLSRSGRRRAVLRHRWQVWANEGIDVLNELGREGLDPLPRPPVCSQILARSQESVDNKQSASNRSVDF